MIPVPPERDPAPGARWCTEVAAVLAAASARAARVSASIAEDWTDDHGREWAERTALLHRELGRAATEAAELAARLGELAAGDGSGERAGAALLRGALDAASRRGPRLGGTAGAHVDGERGMRIAELPPG